MALAKKPSAVKKPTRKSNTKRARTPMRSFVLARDTPPFLSFRITHQTFYWILLCGVVLALGVWVVALNIKVQTLYDQIDRTRVDGEIPVHVSDKTE